jgi:hypothetical protein
MLNASAGRAMLTMEINPQSSEPTGSPMSNHVARIRKGSFIKKTPLALELLYLIGVAWHRGLDQRVQSGADI